MPDKSRECPSCGLEIDREADVCPFCGYDLPRDKPAWKLVAIIAALLLVWPLIQLIRLLF